VSCVLTIVACTGKIVAGTQQLQDALTAAVQHILQSEPSREHPLLTREEVDQLRQAAAGEAQAADQLHTHVLLLVGSLLLLLLYSLDD